MNSRYEAATKVSRKTLMGISALTILKLGVGIMANSTALIADAIHSASDALSTIIILICMRIAKQPADDRHPYGHSRAETIATKLLAILLIIAGLNIMFSTLKTTINGTREVPGILALGVAIFSIIFQEGMYRYNYKMGKQLGSQALISDAWHHRSDAFSSIASSAGILVARLGFPVLDPIAAFVVALLILKVGWQILRQAMDEMMDAQVEPEIIEQIATTALNIPLVKTITEIRAHRYGADLHVSCKIGVPRDLSFTESHQILHQVEAAIEQEVTNTAHVSIHVEPVGQSTN